MKSQHSTKVCSLVISLEILKGSMEKRQQIPKPKIQKPTSLKMRIEWQQGQNGKWTEHEMRISLWIEKRKCAFSHQYYFARSDFLRYHYKIFFLRKNPHCKYDFKQHSYSYTWRQTSPFPTSGNLVWHFSEYIQIHTHSFPHDMLRYAAGTYPIFITLNTHRAYNEHA